MIHAVGPVYDGTARSAELLASAVRAALQMADDHGLKSVALPAISTGIFGYPMEEAAQVMLQAAIAYLEGACPEREPEVRSRRETKLERVVFCLYGRTALDIFTRELAAIRSS